MKIFVPMLNKTQLRNVLQVSPPGTFDGFIDWKNIVVRPLKGAEKDAPWREVYIPYDLPTSSYISLSEMESVFSSIERVWGPVQALHGEGTKALIKFNGKHCFYLCFRPKESTTRG